MNGKKALSAIIFSIFLIFMAAGLEVVNADIVATNGLILASGPYIMFPSNITYTSSFLSLNVSFHAAIFGNVNHSMIYSLDGNNNETVPLVKHYFGWQQLDKSYIDGSVTLPELSEGPHSILVYLECNHETWDGAGSHIHTYFDSQAIYFTIMDTTSPKISLLIENKTYSQNDLSLNFTTDEPTSWIGYCLDGKANITISGNTTLTGLSNGSHSVVIYANDTAGNVGACEIVTFSIDTSEPFPAAALVATASGASVAVIGVGLFVYFRKPNH
jgi:hypothetical protein